MNPGKIKIMKFLLFTIKAIISIEFIAIALVIYLSSCNIKTVNVIVKGKKHQLVFGVPNHSLKKHYLKNLSNQ